MPLKRCSVCGKMDELSGKQWGMTEFDGEYTCSLPCVLLWIKRDPGQAFPFPSWESSKRASPNSGIPDHFRSSYEQGFSLWLEDNQVLFQYEAFTFSVGDSSSYTPDFYLPQYECFIEVKGKWAVGQKRKMGRFRREYPEVRLLVMTCKVDVGDTCGILD